MITMQAFTAFLIAFSSHNRLQIVLLHNSQNSLWISMNPLLIKPNCHPLITASLFCLHLTLFDFLSQQQILCRFVHSFYIVIVSTTRHIEKPAHLTDRKFVAVAKNHSVFYKWPHSFSVNERKSRINSFSISKRLIYLSLLASSYCSCVTLLNC